jgi:putative ABC transport system permease protein
MRMARGRPFNDRDTATNLPVAIVNEEFARRHLDPKGDPIGQKLILYNATQVEVVGVVRQVRVQGPADSASLEIYVPAAQSYFPANGIALRASGDPLALASAARAAMARVDKDLALYAIKTLDEVADEAVARPRFRAVLASAFAGAALALAALGVYSVLAYAAGQRRREFGIRMALGATGSNVLRLVLKQGGAIVCAGVAAGLVLAGLLVRSLTTLLFGVTPFDPVTFLIAPAILAAVALSACAIPARRAMLTDPAVALHEE